MSPERSWINGPEAMQQIMAIGEILSSLSPPFLQATLLLEFAISSALGASSFHSLPRPQRKHNTMKVMLRDGKETRKGVGEREWGVGQSGGEGKRSQGKNGTQVTI